MIFYLKNGCFLIKIFEVKFNYDQLSYERNKL